MSGKTSRARGIRWQSDLALRWRTLGIYPDAASTQGSQVRSKRGIGKTPPDVDGTPFWVEASHGKASPTTKLKQAIAEVKRAGDERPPITVVRPLRASEGDAVVSMRLEDFERLILAQREGWESE